MSKRRLARLLRTILFISLAAALFAALPALAQSGVRNLRATNISTGSITVKWDATPGFTTYDVFYGPADVDYDDPAGRTDGTSFTINGLRSDTEYRISVGYNILGFSRITVRTEEKQNRRRRSEELDYERPPILPPPVTCPHLPPRVVVNGYIVNTQCQMVGGFVIAKTDLSERGFIDAVDVWGNVPAGVEVCFRNSGWLAFLDADYAPRKASELQSHERDGMTCGTIDRAGTVVLLASAPPAANPAASTLPTFDSIPLNDCQIKLVETLFLRATPGGEIIGLVWLNSEVPAFEINGYWYKVEFEGLTGYISRYYREVLWGNCG